MGYTENQKRAYDLAWRNKRRQEWIDSKGGVCAICGSTDRLEVDHVDRFSKKLEPRKIWSRRQEIRDEELAKCQVLCQTHHKEKTILELSIDHPHGSEGRYTKGCRCTACSKAGVARVQTWRKLNMPV